MPEVQGKLKQRFSFLQDKDKVRVGYNRKESNATRREAMLRVN